MNYEIIREQLLAKNLTSFQDILDKARMIGNWDIAAEVETLWTTYKQMMQFMLSGVEDTKAEGIRNSICDKLSIAVTRLERQERMQTQRYEKYVSEIKKLQNTPSFESLVSNMERVATETAQATSDELLRDSIRKHTLDALAEEHEATLKNLFNWVWTSEPWSNSDVNLANRIILSDCIKSDDKAVFISAVGLSLLEYADKAKALFLLDCYILEDAQVAQRALVGFIIALHRDLIYYQDFKELTDRLEIYKEDEAFVSDFFSTLTLLVSSCTTDKVTSKMRDDIMPTLMQSKLSQMGKGLASNSMSIEDLTKNGENPEWLDDEKMNKKLKEMTDLQLEGADVYYSSFSTMKGYAFFHEMPHWFYPFSTDNLRSTDMQKILTGSMGQMIKLMLNSGPFCNSDKYSICYVFSQMPMFNSQVLESQIEQQLDGAGSLSDLIEDADKRVVTNKELQRQYIFDLYRFYYSYPYKAQFRNPFEVLKATPISADTNSLFAELFTLHPEETEKYAEFLMRKGFYASAKQIFTAFASNEFDEGLASVWQKLGFCFQKTDDPEAALHAYEVANSLRPNSKWTLNRIASLAKSLGRNDLAEQSYKALLDFDADSIHNLTQAASACMANKHYAEALPLLHKANFINEKDEAIMLKIAECLIMTNEKDKAMKYILTALADNPDSTEATMLYSIVMIISGNKKEAYANMKRIIANEEAEKSFDERMELLKENNLIDNATCLLFKDALKLNID